MCPRAMTKSTRRSLDVVSRNNGDGRCRLREGPAKDRLRKVQSFSRGPASSNGMGMDTRRPDTTGN